MANEETIRELTKLAHSLVEMLQSEQRILIELKAMSTESGGLIYRQGSQLRDLALAIDELKVEVRATNRVMNAMLEHSIVRTVVHDAKDKKIEEINLTVRYLIEAVIQLTDRMPDLFTED